MSDKILSIYSPRADFSTAKWGVLHLVDDKIEFNRPKAFNRSRLMLDCGVNSQGILRRGVWELAKYSNGKEATFDWEDKGYFDLLREYAAILHQPYQKAGKGKGADVVIDIFDGCSETWMYSDPTKAKKLMQTFFGELAYLPYIKFSFNELNKPAALAFVRDVAYPEFKRAKIMPFTYKTSADPNDRLLENQKGVADRVWQVETTRIIWRAVHGVLDERSETLLYAFINWAREKHLIRALLSVDGVFTGASECDWILKNGRIQRRPSPEQFRRAIRFWLDNVRDLWLPGGDPLYAFEYLPKAPNNDLCSRAALEVVAEEYLRKFGKALENYGKYPDNWMPIPTPEPPMPPTPPQPPAPPEPTPEKSCYEKYIADRPMSKWQVWKFLKCLFY